MKGEVTQALNPRPPVVSQVSVINGTSPFARDYDLTHIVAAYQERNGESWAVYSGAPEGLSRLVGTLERNRIRALVMVTMSK